MEQNLEKLLEIKNLEVSFTKKGRHIKALNRVNLSLAPGSVLAIVGESGSGKSTLALSVMGLLETDNLSRLDGEISFQGQGLLKKSSRQMNQIRGAGIGMVFQEPLYALNPALCIGQQIEEALAVHHIGTKADRRHRVVEVMHEVGLPEPEKYYKFFPSQLSGGMKQRVVIAMAMVCGPSLIIADEPTTALDVTTQAQILELLGKLKREKKLSIILITHDLGVVAELADQVAVLYLGNLMEYGNTAGVLKSPRHPYTQGLLKCIPYADQKQERLYTIPHPGISAADIKPDSCSFHPRCPMARPQCAEHAPLLQETGEHRLTGCPYWEEMI